MIGGYRDDNALPLLKSRERICSCPIYRAYNRSVPIAMALLVRCKPANWFDVLSGATVRHGSYLLLAVDVTSYQSRGNLGLSRVKPLGLCAGIVGWHSNVKRSARSCPAFGGPPWDWRRKFTGSRVSHCLRLIIWSMMPAERRIELSNTFTSNSIMASGVLVWELSVSS